MQGAGNHRRLRSDLPEPYDKISGSLRLLTVLTVHVHGSTS